MYVCLCADKCEDDIQQLLDQGITDLEEIMEISGAGTGCGTCQLWVQNMIEGVISSS